MTEEAPEPPNGEVIAWRLGCLLGSGLSFDLSEAISVRFDIDLHSVLRAVSRGATEEQVGRIFL